MALVISIPSKSTKQSSSTKVSKDESCLKLPIIPSIEKAPLNFRVDKSKQNLIPSVVVKTIPKVRGSYRYKLLPGNNVRCVLNALRRRTWWHPVANEESLCANTSANIIWEQYRNMARYRDNNHENVVLNHLQNNACLVSKKGLYFSLREYCKQNNVNLLDIVPRTFYLATTADNSINSDDYADFMEYSKQYNMNKNTAQSCANTGLIEIKNVPEDSKELVRPVEGDCATESKDIGPTQTGTNDSIETNKIVTETSSAEGLIWILKPAARANRGYGIQVVKGVENVMNILKISQEAAEKEAQEKETNRKEKGEKEEKPATDLDAKQAALQKEATRMADKEGWVVQEYMQKPLLVSGRKFDIRCFVLLTYSTKQGFKGYFFKDAYVRTSSKEYSLDNIDDREAHLTNDAVQKFSKTYGKFESGNKLNMVEWQEQINRDYPHAAKDIVASRIMPEVVRLTALSLAACADKLGQSDVKNTFELLGYDYMVNDQFEPKLIEINSNPCLEFACPLLKEIISSVVENTIKVAIDPYFPPPSKDNRTAACQEAVAELEKEEIKFTQIWPSQQKSDKN